jgi:hypothetical protein
MPKEKKRGFHHGDGGARRKRNGGDMHGLGCGADVVHCAHTRTHVVHTRASLPRRVIRAWQTESKKKGFYGGGEKGGGGDGGA